MGTIKIDEEIKDLFRKALKRHSKGELCYELGTVRSSSIISKMLSGHTKTMHEWQRERLIELVKGE